jgi:polyphosphate kinase 2 (PPK2 family)
VVLAVRVHPEALARQKLPPTLVTKRIWEQRFQDIRNFERFLARNGTVVRKFFLYVSEEAQKKRLLARLENEEKNWKFSPADIPERGYWDKYMSAFEEMIRQTASREAPWYVVPADNKWFTRLVVADAIVDTLKKLKLSFPKVDAATRKELRAARIMLEKESRR